ncbi:MAG: hypothetical protein RMJ33_09350 [Saprospiraceae bacterium]|nr:hypothetical protein [Saprospiraceae bacterium]MDW8230029.1 hypothetical protein [Saprospiraceae bacterium]
MNSKNALLTFWSRRPFFWAGLAGLLALLAAVLMANALREVSFETPPPFRDAVMAIEWAPSAETMDVVLGAAPERARRIEALLQATARDGLFVLAYTLFMCAFAVTAAWLSHRWRYLLLAALALAVGLADLAENGAIRALLLLYDSETFEPGGADYVRVRLFAWAKWAGITLYFIGIAPFLWSRGWVLGRLLALLAAAVAVMWVLAQFLRAWAELYSLAVFLLFAIAIGYCFVPVRASAAPPASS